MEGEVEPMTDTTTYVVNFDSRDKRIQVPADASLKLTTDSPMPASTGDKNMPHVVVNMPVLTIWQGDKLLAAFYGVSRFYPETFKAEEDDWAR